MTEAAIVEMRRRLVRGISASAMSPLVTALIQFGTVPVLLSAWGAGGYGDWLLLSAAPTYLAQSDLGFADASASDMTARAAAGDREGALCTFQSSWLLLTIVSSVVGLLASFAIWQVNWRDLFHLSTVSNEEARIILTMMLIYVTVGQQARMLEPGFRCEGRYAAGTFWANMMRLVEAFSATVAGVLSSSLVTAAVVYAIARCVSAVFYYFVLRSKSCWITLGIRHARWQSIKQLASPAIAFVALPLGQAIELQGYTILIGMCLGPTAVAAFSTLRTLTRVNYQFVAVIGRSVWPELSAALGAGEISLARNLHRRAAQAALCLSLGGAFALLSAGPFVYRTWVHSSVAFNTTCFTVLALVVAANAFWHTSLVVPMSCNRHQRIAWTYFATTLLSLAVARVLMPFFGITGAAFALLLIDASLCCLVLRTALLQLDDTFRQFWSAITTLPRLGGPLSSKLEAV